MKEMIQLPPKSFLDECFCYNENTGILTWKERPREHFKSEGKWRQFLRDSAGKEAGIKLFRGKTKDDPLCLRIKMQWMGVRMYPSAHRLIFALMEIAIPEGYYIDHKNGNPFDNRLVNLRLSSPSENCRNQRTHKEKQSGLPKGVSTYGRLGKYRMACMIEGKSFQKYGFLTPEAAYAEYCRLSQELHGSFHRPS